MIISFGWTTPALLAGQKTVTRRDWKHEHAARFQEGMLVDAWNTSPRNTQKDPRKVATIRILSVSREWTSDIRGSDWHAEGFQYLTDNGLSLNGHTPREHWDGWRYTPERLYVVRFEVVEYLEGPLA